MPNRRKETNIYAGNKKIKLQEWHSYNPERQKERAKRVDIVREKERKKERERKRQREKKREREREKEMDRKIYNYMAFKRDQQSDRMWN